MSPPQKKNLHSGLKRYDNIKIYISMSKKLTTHHSLTPVVTIISTFKYALSKNRKTQNISNIKKLRLALKI